MALASAPRGVAVLVAATWFAAVTTAPVHAQIPRGTCMVSDPTGTPLNVREYPNGPVIGTLRNGRIVRVIKTRLARRGRPWAQLAGSDGPDIGWVFREYISCRR